MAFFYGGSEMNELMVDLETVNNKPSSAIISVGLVKFNLEDEDDYETLDDPKRSFYCVLDVDAQVAFGATMSFETFSWWMKQNAMAKGVFQEKPTYPHNVDAIQKINEFIGKSEPYLWGNGSDFDGPIIRHFYDLYGYEFPVPFWKNMCFRTQKRFAKRKVEIDRGIAHNALEDAKYQVLLAQAYAREA